ncbi:MAG: ParB/RepB/Spo0J family partition protein [Lachnospiraceae bacterium]|jgi:ParB family chromosome partitioning protein|nr:ParB/RepB/Spo0J family partition protein [Lachnospiraceae bacterium]
MAAKNTKRGLGKGLDSLIPKGEAVKKSSSKSNNGVVELDINQVEPNKNQPRKNFDQDALNELADSIKQYGVIQPIVVQKIDDYYEIIAGERRWRAAKIAKLKKIPVVIKNFSEQEIVEIALIENIQREDLNPIEEAEAYKRLIDEYNLKQEEMAERLSKSRTSITNSMRLLKLSSKVQKLVISGELSSGHARALIPVEDAKKQYTLALEIIKNKLSVRETEKLVKALLEPKKKVKKAVPENDFVYRDIEGKIKDIVGTKVKINNKPGGKGKIEIEYYSTEDLERLIDLFEKMK